jgi:hypothetical protein
MLKKLVKGLAIAVGGGLVIGTASVVLGVASAHATIAVIGSRGDMDPYHYRDQLRYTGLYHEDVTNALSLGHRVCAARYRGFTEGQLVSSLDNFDEYTSEQAVGIVDGAEFHFCPGYEDDGTIGSGSRWYGGPIL